MRPFSEAGSRRCNRGCDSVLPRRQVPHLFAHAAASTAPDLPGAPEIVLAPHGFRNLVNWDDLGPALLPAAQAATEPRMLDGIGSLRRGNFHAFYNRS